jgi:Dna[CI] antecedent, DciA
MALAAVRAGVEAITRQLKLSTELSVLERAWDTEIGALGGRARLAALDRTTLVVEVISSAALQEITLRRRELVRRLNTHFLKPWIEHMTVRMTDGH